MKTFLFVAGLAAAMTAGCAVTDDGATMPTEGAEADFVSIRTSHCELFVDRALAVSGGHAVKRITLYVKTLNDRLDSPIEYVGFHRRKTSSPVCHGTSGPCSPSVSGWEDERLQPFVGSQDYYEISLLIGGDYMPDESYEGVFFVQTKNKSRYWLNTEGGGNFFVNLEMFRNLERIRSGAYGASPEGAVVAADQFPYLNPQRCR